MHRLIIILLVITLSAFESPCQTTRYWSSNFASEPSILAGAIVGGYAENLSVYYNPALIYENTYNNVSFSNEIVSIDFYKAKNSFGRGFDLRVFQFNVLPGFVSLNIKSKKHEELSFQVALLTKDKNDFDVSESFSGSHDIYPEINGIEKYSNLYGSVIRYTDTWLGGGASYRFSNKFSIGISSFISVKKLDDKLTKSINIIPDYESNPGITEDSSYRISNAREISRLNMLTFQLQSKIGVQYRSGPWSLGMKISLPSITLFGTGNRYREIGINNLYFDLNDRLMNDFLVVGSERRRPARYKDPLSVAVGINYSNGQEADMLGISLEYFHKIPVYSLVDVQGTSMISSPVPVDDPDFLSVWLGARSLWNFAIGYRKYINPGLTLLGGFRTDFDYLKEVDFSRTSNRNNQFIRYLSDVYHLTAGARFNISRHRFIVGAQYSFGQEKGLRQLANFVPGINLDGVDLPVENLDEFPVTYSINSLSLFFGFIFNFLND